MSLVLNLEFEATTKKKPKVEIIQIFYHGLWFLLFLCTLRLQHFIPLTWLCTRRGAYRKIMPVEWKLEKYAQLSISKYFIEKNTRTTICKRPIIFVRSFVNLIRFVHIFSVGFFFSFCRFRRCHAVVVIVRYSFPSIFHHITTIYRNQPIYDIQIHI